jgi:hypothetical protein
MNNRLSPATFARVLRLDDRTRVNLLELLGEAPVAEDDVARLLDELEMKDRMARLRRSFGEGRVSS